MPGLSPEFESVGWEQGMGGRGGEYTPNTTSVCHSAAADLGSRL